MSSSGGVFPVLLRVAPVLKRHAGPARTRALLAGFSREGASPSAPETAVRFGVRKVEERLETRAWVELDGKVLRDTPDVHGGYTAFASIDWPKGARWV